MKFGRNHELKRSETYIESCPCTQPSRGSPDQRQGVWRTLSPGGYPSFSTRMGAIFQLPQFVTSCDGKEISCACLANCNWGSRKVSLERRFLLESNKARKRAWFMVRFLSIEVGLVNFLYRVYDRAPNLWDNCLAEKIRPFSHRYQF